MLLSIDMNLRQFVGCVERFCPPGLALPGDFVGMQVGPSDAATQERTRIRKCAVAVEASPQVILKAASGGANILLVCHGISSIPVKAITDELFDKVRLLIENRVLLHVVHSSWLSAECGLNDTLADVLGLVVTEPLTVEDNGKEIPIGRICSFSKRQGKEGKGIEESTLLSNLIEKIIERLRSNDVEYAGSLNAPVKKLAVLAGDYNEADLLRLAHAKGVDTFLTASISRDMVSLSLELGLSYVSASQHAIEDLGMRRLMQLLGIDAPEVEFFFVESQPPWKTYVYPHSLTGRDTKTGRE
jgi:dinuclear metal center YbgI/SA1388 family protein